MGKMILVAYPVNSAEEQELAEKYSYRPVVTALKKPLPEQGFAQILGAALYIAVTGVDDTGERTKGQAMYPCQTFTDHAVRKEVATFLLDVHTALLEAVPQETIQRLVQGRASRLGAIEEWAARLQAARAAPPDETSRSREFE